MTSNTSRPNRFLKEQRELRNWTLNDVANELDQLCHDDEVSERGVINAQMVSGWERGKHLPSKLWRTKLCDLYGKSPLELGFVQHLSQVTFSQEEVSEPGTESDEDVNRREATKRIATLFGTALLMTPYDLLSPQSLEQLSRALVKPAHIDTELLGHFEDITESCWHLMMRDELEIAEHTLWGYLPRLWNWPEEMETPK